MDQKPKPRKRLNIMGMVGKLLPQLATGRIKPEAFDPILEEIEPHLAGYLQRMAQDNLREGEHHIALHTVESEGKVLTYLAAVDAEGSIVRMLGEAYTFANLSSRLAGDAAKKQPLPKGESEAPQPADQAPAPAAEQTDSTTPNPTPNNGQH